MGRQLAPSFKFQPEKGDLPHSNQGETSSLRKETLAPNLKTSMSPWIPLHGAPAKP